MLNAASLTVVCLLMLHASALDYKWMKNSLRDGLTQAEKKFLLDVHNFYRRAVVQGGIIGDGPGAGNMRELVWDDSLAIDAQAWSTECGGPMHNQASERNYSGQNYMGHSNRADIFKLGMIAWADDEAPLYSYPGFNYLESGAGHYTQIVWAHSYKLGCGFSMCDGFAFGRLICHFMVAGNFNELKLYEAGLPCSKCDPGYGYCNDKLCTKSCSGSKCRCTVDRQRCERNGGKFNATKCFCECPAGKDGLNCDKTCEDTKWCQTYMCAEKKPFYHQGEAFCPKTCEKCKPECKDKHADCKMFADNGECQKNPGWMEPNCLKSCKLC